MLRHFKVKHSIFSLYFLVFLFKSQYCGFDTRYFLLYVRYFWILRNLNLFFLIEHALILWLQLLDMFWRDFRLVELLLLELDYFLHISTAFLRRNLRLMCLQILFVLLPDSYSQFFHFLLNSRYFLIQSSRFSIFVFLNIWLFEGYQVFLQYFLHRCVILFQLLHNQLISFNSIFARNHCLVVRITFEALVYIFNLPFVLLFGQLLRIKFPILGPNYVIRFDWTFIRPIL